MAINKRLVLLTTLALLSSCNFCQKLPYQCKVNTSESFVCNDLGLTEIPRDIRFSVTYIDLSNNPRLEFKNDYFLRFKNLLILYLTNCGRVDPVLFPASLKQLHLNRNSLKAESVRKMFSKASQNLTILDLSENGLLLEPVISVLPKGITALFLSGNILPRIGQHLFHGFRRLLELNLDTCGIEIISQHSFDSLLQLSTLRLGGNNFTKVPNHLFKFLKKLRCLYLQKNKFTRPPDVLGPAQLQLLDLGRNKIEKITPYDFYRQKIVQLTVSSNRIRFFDLRYTSYLGIDLSYNKIETLNAFAFQGRKRLFYLRLQMNNISYISPSAFKGLTDIGSLYLQRNSIRTLPRNIFNNMVIGYLFLYGNQIETMDEVLNSMLSPPKLLLLFSNPPLQEFKIEQYRTMSNDSRIFISCNNFKQFRGYGELQASVRCFPSMKYTIYISDLTLGRDGYNCTRNDRQQIFQCTPCALGYFTDLSCDDGCCKKCPAGSFYQDELAATVCKRCPLGQFVPPDKFPGKSALECVTCPDGTKKNKAAGYRACFCLSGFARTDRFGICSKCNQDGLICQSDYPILQKDYWWIWHDASPSNITCKSSFIAFMNNLETENDSYARNSSIFKCTLPLPHRCPIKGSCLGGVNATCQRGYTGVLCSVCQNGYSRSFRKCIKCPGKVYAVLKLIGYMLLFIILCALVAWAEKIKQHDGEYRRTFADIILSNFKILIGFYQVLVANLNAFSSISWPSSLVAAVGFFHFIQFEVFRIPSFRCINPELELNAVDEFWIALFGTAAFALLVLFYFGTKKIYLYFSVSMHEEFTRRSKTSKKNCLRVLLLFLFVIYPLLSQRIFGVLPISCHSICTSSANGRCHHQMSYLRDDYSVRCLSFSGKNRLALISACVAMVIPLGFPVVIFLFLWKFAPKRTNQTSEQGKEHLSINESRLRNEYDIFGEENENGELAIPGDTDKVIERKSDIQYALAFLYENYSGSHRYWEAVEMLRKLIMTAGVRLFVGFGYYKIAMSVTIAIAGFFAILHAWSRPMKHKFENVVQLISLSVVALNLCLGLALESTFYREYQQKSGDNLAVSLMFVAANLIVFVLVAFRLIPILFKAMKILCGAMRRCCKRDCFFKAHRNDTLQELLL